MAQTAKRTARIEARISPQALSVVKRAAEMQGRSVSDFVVAAAQEIAQRTVDHTEIVRLSKADQERVFKLLLNPPPPTEAMKRALKARKRLIRQG